MLTIFCLLVKIQLLSNEFINKVYLCRAVEEAQNLGSSDEVDFLLSEIGKISGERATLQQRVQELMRANQCLTEEITIIRAHIEAAGDAVPLSPGFTPSEGHHSHQLAEERAHTAALENELEKLKKEMERLQMKTNHSNEDTSPNSPRIRAGKNTNRKKKNNKLATLH
jgi:predicted  nucleic acid-binding Zn-ribbon protein